MAKIARRNRNTIMEGQTETFHYQPPLPAVLQEGIIRVAAYCRVSTLADEQELSFQTQRDYYTSLIENSPNMVLVGVYGDQGFSGLRAAPRKEFQQMLADCRAGKIDMIMVKSISRFSRNAVECLKYVNELKELGIRVMFEKESMDSLDPTAQMALSIFATIAQNESCSHSENIRWAKKVRAEMGDPIRGSCYGYRIEKVKGPVTRHWVIVEEEAKRIRLMFNMAYQGYTIAEICEAVNQLEADAGSDVEWLTGRIRSTLRNEAYKGDILTNKTVCPDYLTKKSVKNVGQFEQFELIEHHDPIVLPAVFDTVQEYLEKGYLNGRNKALRAAWFQENPEVQRRRTETAYEHEEEAAV